MKTDKIEKKLRGLSKTVEKLAGTEVKKFRAALTLEESLKRELHRTHSLHFEMTKQGFDLTEITAIQNRIHHTMRDVSTFILEEFNKKYQMNLLFEELLQGFEGMYEREGILRLIEKRNILQDAFEKELKSVLPLHPKDEFIETRKMKRHFVIHTGPTNSGKTHQSLERLKVAKSGLYLAPLRLLALEIFERLNGDGIPTSLLTGEEEISVPFSYHTSSTIEKANYGETYEVVVIDEGQLLGDTQRGCAWTKAILGVRAEEIHICCSLNAVPLIQNMIEECGDSIEIHTHERQTPLVVEEEHFTFPQDVKKGDALIVFSRKMVLRTAAALSEANMKASLIYGSLPPETRRKQVDLFLEGKSDVVVSTDAIGMGLNLPIQRVIFLEGEKFDGEDVRELTSQEVKQIAGRAGRKGMYEIGYVNSVSRKKRISSLLSQRDEHIETAYVEPVSSTILSLPFGSLKERLEAWNQYEWNTSFYEKADISEMLDLLEYERSFAHDLSQEEILKAVKIPFNTREEALLALWLRYMKQLKNQNTVFEKPTCTGDSLEDWETYYRSIDLYYSFSKIFSDSVEEEWIREEREYISNHIHQLLTARIKSFKKKCSSCGRPLPWNSFYGKCQSCFSTRS